MGAKLDKIPLQIFTRQQLNSLLVCKKSLEKSTLHMPFLFSVHRFTQARSFLFACTALALSLRQKLSRSNFSKESFSVSRKQGRAASLSQVRHFILHRSCDLLEAVSQLHFLGRGVLLQRSDDLVVVFIDVLVEFMQSHQVVEFSRVVPG